MSGPNMEITPLEYVAASKREREVGNHHKAAALMWQATQATFAALADAHGVEYKKLDEDEVIKIAKALEAQGGKHAERYRNGLAPCALLKDHAEMDVLEIYQLELAYETGENFIRACLDVE